MTVQLSGRRSGDQNGNVGACQAMGSPARTRCPPLPWSFHALQAVLRLALILIVSRSASPVYSTLPTLCDASPGYNSESLTLIFNGGVNRGVGLCLLPSGRFVVASIRPFVVRDSERRCIGHSSHVPFRSDGFTAVRSKPYALIRTLQNETVRSAQI